HANVAREMLEAPGWRDWVTPKVSGVPYRNKPAPYYWVLATSFARFGVDERAARLVSALPRRAHAGGGARAAGLVPALAGVATAGAVCLWAAARWGPGAGALAGVVLVTAPEYFVLGRFVTADMALTLWVTLGLLAVYRFAQQPGRSLVPAAVAGACGLLTKGLIAPGLIAGGGVEYSGGSGGRRPSSQ